MGKDAKSDLGGSSEDQELAGDPVIGQLKTMYDSVVDEPLPQELINLLSKLDEAERKR